MPNLGDSPGLSNGSELLDALKIAERRRHETQRLSGVGFWELNHKEDTLYWSEEIFVIYALEPDLFEPDFAIFENLIDDDDRDWVTAAFRNSVATKTQYDIRYRIKAGTSMKWIEARGVTYYDDDGNPERTIGTAQDISEIIDAQQALEHLALHDELTGLANRKLFSIRMAEGIQAARLDQSKLGVAFIDLDDFKLINDYHGHAIGDELLVGVARRLDQAAQSGDTFARVGGDEFVGLFVEATDEGIEGAVRKIKEAIDGRYKTSAGSFTITASIGVAFYPKDSEEPDELLRYADHAMYEAKETGKSRIRRFDARRHQTNRSRNKFLQEIEKTIQSDQFVLQYQPRICLADGSLAGAEALLRWYRKEGPVSPSEVILAISGTSLEWTLDAWVVKKAIADTRKFLDHGLRGPFSLNLNPSTIENELMPDLLEEQLTNNGVSGDDVEIELLEVALIRDFKLTNEILRRCKKLGVSFSLDDFGTGYSSLTYFQSLAVDKLKIDRAFIKRLLMDKESLALVNSILALAAANDRPVIAEGVESHAIAKALRTLGCQYGQGFGLAEPMAFEDYLSWADQWNPQSFIDGLNALD